MSSSTKKETGVQAKVSYNANEPMPRGGLNTSETMPFSLAYSLLFSHGLVTSTLLPQSGEEPHLIFIAPPKQPPRLPTKL
jgi:hypothetical protein